MSTTTAKASLKTALKFLKSRLNADGMFTLRGKSDDAKFYGIYQSHFSALVRRGFLEKVEELCSNKYTWYRLRDGHPSESELE